MLLSLWLGHLLDSWAEICQIFALFFWKIYDINKAFWNQLTFNEIESTETDNAVKGEEDTATKIDIESFEQNLTESETTKLDVGVLEQNSTELEKKTAQIDDGGHEQNSTEFRGEYNVENLKLIRHHHNNCKNHLKGENVLFIFPWQKRLLDFSKNMQLYTLY